MASVQHIFVGPLTALQNADDVLAGLARNVIVKAERCGQAQWHRLEAWLLGRSHLLGEIMPCGCKNLCRNALLNPAIRRSLACTGILRLRQKLRSGPARIDYIPAISGRRIVMDNEHGGSPLARGFLIFVRPAAVICHGLAAEFTSQILGIEIRVVDHDDNGFAFNIDPRIIVPALFRGNDAVADENQFVSIKRGFGDFAVAADDKIAAICKRGSLAGFVSNAQRRHILGSNFNERNVLRPAAVVARLQSCRPKLLDQIGDGLFLAGRTGRTAFIAIERKLLGHILHRLFGKCRNCDLGRDSCGRHIEICAGSQCQGRDQGERHDTH